LARAALERDWEWWRGTMASRKADPSRFRRVVIMQCLNETDLGRRCVEEGYTHLMLPMRFEAARKCVTRWGGDRRTVEGELLCPQRFDEESVAKTERDMGSQVAAAQLQQRPAPAKGLIFERTWLANEWRELPSHPRWIQSWDCAFKDLSTSDYVVGQVWCQRGAEYFLVHQVRARMSFSETCQAIRDVSVKYPLTTAKLIEDKANGTAVIEALTREIPGIIAIEPDGGKLSRAHSASPMFEAGNVKVPALASAPWVAEWREEMAVFPMGRYDDAVDATTQAVRWMHQNPDGRPEDIKSESHGRFDRRVGL
jgi:predicted phage terminase large subunit-like protein